MRCNTHRIEELRIQFWMGYLNLRDHSEDLGVDGRIILRMHIRESR